MYNHYHKQETEQYINNNNNNNINNNNNNNNGKNSHDLNSMPNNNKHGALTTRVSSTTAKRTIINGSKQDKFIGACIPSTKDNKNIQQNQELMVKGEHTNNIHQHNYLHGVAATSTITKNTGSVTTTTTTLALKHHPHDKNSAVATVNHLRDRIFLRTFKATTEILNSYNDNKRVRWASDLVDVHTYKVPKSKKTSSWTVLRQKLRKAVTALKDDIDL